ncbi:DUF169 domain-containing protein [Selenomonas sp. AE3005]|uniref:DUF169 domain-containing protein n=1 Tax=Selenomonas sp. AE3005 TaxID=1485543 RepID=UPI0025CEDD8F|nr:DUF169 domain-containing protein [Selenomonas sp. AE3005]
MESKIAKHICLNNHPVAVLRADSVPEKAICFKEGKWGCVVALIKAASQGKIAAAAKDTTVCMGGRAGLGFQGYEHGWIEYFLSTGNDKIPHSEFYKKTPELAKIFTETIPKVEAPACLVFKPLEMVEEDEKPECIIFLVNADQLSGLTTLANYDRISQNNVQVNFASGCGQAVLYPLSAEEKGEKTCYIGMTDPSARKVISKEHMSFSIPYSRFLEMEQEADGCFFTTDTWETIKKRI